MLKNILFICGSGNQTTMMHKISEYLTNYNCYFTPYYSHGIIGALSKTSLLNFSILGGQFRQRTLEYLQQNYLNIDLNGLSGNYDLVITCSDLIMPKNIRSKKVILVQEGMTDPQNLAYYIVKYTGLPRWMASTSTTGLSHLYDKFCVASEGYRQHFINKGVNPAKIVVTGIPNFDNCIEYYNNNFPHNNFALVATSDSRETFKYENRKYFIERAVSIAGGRQLIFKLHPNENYVRATDEINRYAPGALVYTNQSIEPMIANCDVLITRFSTVVYVGLALGKEVYSEFNLAELKKLMPLQNGGTSAMNIAAVAEELINSGNIKLYFSNQSPAYKTGSKRRFKSNIIPSGGYKIPGFAL
jgi:hypothetical protein